ncbi:hypothetical protein ACHQM5_026396 [Ranunculus cassubicifolius]
MKAKQAKSKQAKQTNSPSVGAKTTSSPAPFSDIGKKVKDLLTKDYNFENKFILTIPNENGMVVTATGATRDQIFLGDISTHYKSKNAVVDVKVDSRSNVSAKVVMNEIFPSMNAVLKFNVPVHRSGKVSTRLTTKKIFPSIKAALTFNIPFHKSGKVDVQYLHPHTNISSSIGLTPSPLVEFSTTIGTKKLSLGGEVGFDTSTASFTKYNTGIGLNTPDLSASLMLTNKGETLKMSFIQSVNPIKGATIAADLSHKFTTYENTYTFGSSYEIDSLTLVKTRISHNGRIGIVCQREWRPKSLITVSGEYDSKAIGAPPRLGLTLALKP